MQCLKVPIGRAVMLEWVDSAAKYGWSKDLEPRTPPVKTLGFVVGNNRKAVVVTTSVDVLSTGLIAMDPLSIPWCAVKKAEILPGDFSLQGPQREDYE